MPFAIHASPRANTAGSLPGVAVLDIQHADQLTHVRRRLRALLDDGYRTVLAGPPDLIAQVRPSYVYAWPATNTVVLDPGAGLGVFGFDATDTQARLDFLAGWPWQGDALFLKKARHERAVPQRPTRLVDFRATGASPSEVCKSFAHQLAAQAFRDGAPSTGERRAFRREFRRWCQYGNLSVHVAEPAQFTIEPFRWSNLPLLTLTAEWALIRTEDPSDAARTSYLFWTRTVGDGAGTGFTRPQGSEAWLDADTDEVRGLMDVAIHSGWGSIEPRHVVTAWPLNSTFPLAGNVHVFRCDAPPLFRPDDCPVKPALRKLFPEDSTGGTVSITTGETLSVGGDVKFSRSADSEGKQSITATFGLNTVRATTVNVTTDMSLVHTHSNADTHFYRTTQWWPDITALFRWIQARHQQGSLGAATGLAATLNPRHEILWALALADNAGRTLPYHVVYEAGINTCGKTHEGCVSWRRPPDPALRAKARVGWSDGLSIKLPSR